ncbi:MAG: hypothetical protein SNJ72_00030 [Fimbriimonadales bacterium]
MKLNLVPDYVRQRKVNKQILALLVVLFLVVNAGMVFWMISAQSRLGELQARKSELEAQAQQVDSLVNQANSLIQSAAITLAKTEWVKMVQKHNLRYPEIYSQLSRYTSPRVRYEQLQIAQGNQMQISGYTKGIREIGLYLQTMYQCPLFSSVSLTTQMPGYATGGGSAQMAGLPGLGGFGGGPPAALSGPSAAGLSSFGGASAAPGLGGFAGGGSGQSQGSPAGLMQFQVVATLREPVSPPSPPASIPGLNLGGAGAGGFGAPSLGGFGGGGGGPVMGGRGMGI